MSGVPLRTSATEDLPLWTSARAVAEVGEGSIIRLVSKRNMQRASGTALGFPIAWLLISLLLGLLCEVA